MKCVFSCFHCVSLQMVVLVSGLKHVSFNSLLSPIPLRSESVFKLLNVLSDSYLTQRVNINTVHCNIPSLCIHLNGCPYGTAAIHCRCCRRLFYTSSKALHNCTCTQRTKRCHNYISGVWPPTVYTYSTLSKLKQETTFRQKWSSFIYIY